MIIVIISSSSSSIVSIIISSSIMFVCAIQRKSLPEADGEDVARRTHGHSL